MERPRRPVIPVQPVAGRPSAEALARIDWRWHWATLGWAPHRLGFFLALVVLGAASLWWASVQAAPLAWWRVPPAALPPAVVHAAVMVFGFMPLFFAGFGFTALPKWLEVQPWPVRVLCAPLVLQALGWLAWLGGAMATPALAWVGLGAAWLGLGWTGALLAWLVWCSPLADRLHARLIVVAWGVGWLCLAALGLAVWRGDFALAQALARAGLWGFVLVVFAAALHRMIPFFTSSAMPGIAARRPFWVLALMVGAAWGEAGAALVGEWWPLSAPALLLRGMLELGVGAVLLWLAGVWWRVLGLKNRLLAMLHAGFVWLGLAWVLGGAAHAWHGWQGTAVWPLAMLHALALGCMGALMLAMVSRVSCGHGGRPLVADGLLWSLFWLLQGAVLLRLAAALWPAWGAALLPWAALLWAVVVLAWGLRMGRWYGRPRADGRPG